MEQLITSVARGSVGEALGFEPGDKLLAVDGNEIEDVLDYYFFTDAERFTLSVETKQGGRAEVPVELGPGEELGLSFGDEFMGCYKHCANKCMFCFIDQLPKGLRDTLYFKDDDSRLSFLNGNYITMTNMSERDFEKIIRYHMSPINVSVHTTDPELRVKMLKNPRAAEVNERLARLAEAGITLNGQIVLCKGVNDGEALEKTVRDLFALAPAMQSLSIVPVGLSRFREGLYPLEPFTAEDARKLIARAESWQAEFSAKTGLHFVHLSDEFYSLAGADVPPEESYDGYLQIENGVGMMRLFLNEAEEYLRGKRVKPLRRGRLTVVTAPCAAPYIRRIAEEAGRLVPKRTIEIREIRNDFFGEHITVTGLLTGTDLIAQLAGTDLGDRVLLPGNLFRGEETLMLDDLTLADLEKALQKPLKVVKSSGRDFAEALLS